MIDWTRVAELREEIGPEEFDEVAELFLLEVEDTLGRLDEAIQDAPQMQQLLHFLKGSALNLGFRAMAAMCNQDHRDPVPGQAEIDVSGLKALYARSLAEFEAEYRNRFAA